MSKYATEDKYYIAESSVGELYIYIDAKKDSPVHPQIVYDGFDHALFIRSPEESIILDYINPDARDKLRKARAVIVVETLLELNVTAIFYFCVYYHYFYRHNLKP